MWSAIVMACLLGLFSYSIGAGIESLVSNRLLKTD
jgi:hypothetical protein